MSSLTKNKPKLARKQVITRLAKEIHKMCLGHLIITESNKAIKIPVAMSKTLRNQTEEPYTSKGGVV